MNYTTAVFLINKYVRAVGCTYEAEATAEKTVFKTLDDTIAVDDYVIVPTTTRHKMTVCKVVEVDIDIDFDSAKPCQWIIGKIDDTRYKETLVQEDTAIKAIKSAELRKKRDDLRENMFADHTATLKALPLAAMNGDHHEPKKDGVS